jgi:hypothetical protein
MGDNRNSIERRAGANRPHDDLFLILIMMIGWRTRFLFQGTTQTFFVPFVVSVDGPLAPEAVNTLKQIACKLRNKWQCPYSAVFGYVKSQIGISDI